MSPLPSGPNAGRATPNVYTGLAFISMLATLGALIFMVVKFMNFGVFSS